MQSASYVHSRRLFMSQNGQNVAFFDNAEWHTPNILPRIVNNDKESFGTSHTDLQCFLLR